MKYLAIAAMMVLSLPAFAGSRPMEKSPPLDENHDPLVLASRQVVGPNRLPIGFAYREKPKEKFDSGWVFLSGKESQEFLDDSTNSVLSPLTLFIEMDPSLSELLDKPVGTYWERDSAASPWREIPDYPGGP